MESKEFEQKVNKLEQKQEQLEAFVNKSISSIQLGIVEIKTILQERNEKEGLKNNLLEKDIEAQEKRLKKLEDAQQWLWRTVGAGVISVIIGAIVFVIQINK